MLFSIIVSLVISALVYGIRYTLWKNKVPDNIANVRWIIGITCGVIFLIIGVAMQQNSDQPTPGSHMIYGFLAVCIAGALKNPETDKQNGK